MERKSTPGYFSERIQQSVEPFARVERSQKDDFQGIVLVHPLLDFFLAGNIVKPVPGRPRHDGRFGIRQKALRLFSGEVTGVNHAINRCKIPGFNVLIAFSQR